VCGALPGRNGELVFATYLAPCIMPAYEFIARRVGQELGCRTRLVVGESFQQQRDGEVDFAFLCGLPYVRLRREDPQAVDAIAAPVVAGERYGGRPVYFSDVIVPRESAAAGLDDLRGCRWAYNDPDSHSGYLVTLYSLLARGSSGLFGEWVMTGFHQESIRQVAAGRLDASAVDSQVLSVELQDHPELRDRLRVIDAFGPSSIQPLVATGAAQGPLRHQVREIVTALHGDQAGRAELARGCVERLIGVEDSMYDDIRAMLKSVEEAAERRR
jgi:phosphonate transport system substrate-binding protein